MAQRKRKIKARDIIRDIRSGLTVSQLMWKYRFPLKALRIVFRKLLKAGALTKEELETQRALYRDTVDMTGIRKWLRTTTTLPLRIYDSGNPFATGYVRDISEKGACVEGIKAGVGETKNFVVRSGAFGAGRTFVFEGKCRWVDKEESSSKRWVAGFEITSISSLDSRELHKLIRPMGYPRESASQELVCLVPVYEENLDTIRGSVCELTERAVGITGIEATVGETKKLVIPADEFFNVSPFSFKATCRWVAGRNGDGQSVTGFEITDISSDHYLRLKQLIQLIKLPE